MTFTTDFAQLSHPYMGFAAIEDRLKLNAVQPLTTVCLLAKARSTSSNKGFTKAYFTAQFQPGQSLRDHFEFGLKYDEINLEWLSRLFSTTGPSWIEDWVTDTPTGIYARRAACLYEWLTGNEIASPDTTASNYEDLLDSSKYLVAVVPNRNRRWKLNNNLPGTRDFCPLVRWTTELKEAAKYDISAALTKLDSQFGPDLLMRSAAWLTFAESRATFAIEKEADRASDIKRFAAAMIEHCGKIENPLSAQSLTVLQKEVLGQRALRTGIRKSPVFVGRPAPHGVTVVKYVAPPFSQLGGMLAGLKEFEERTRGASALIRAAVLSFGFVYIHPLADGNGRVHRLLINDSLMRDGAIPSGTILPVSAAIAERRNFGEYDKILNSLSARQIKRFNGCWRFENEPHQCEDGVWTDFSFDADEEAMPFWSFPDLTWHSQYLCQMLRHTVEHNMTEEALFLAQYDEAVYRVTQVVEMPSHEAGRVIRSLRENNMRVSNTLAEQFPSLFSNSADPEIKEGLIAAISSAFQEDLQTLTVKSDRNRF